ncbi:MAG: PAS domain S-box protein [Melioribacteraceae bacterium]
MNSSLEKSFEHSATEISFREIFEFAPIGVVIFQRDWKIKFVNKNFFQFNGVVSDTPQNVIGKSIFENRLFYESDIREELNLLKKGDTFEKEIIASSTLSGGKVSILLKGAPIIINGEFTGGVLILEDIKVDAVKSHGSLIFSEDFQTFLGSLSDFFVVVDKEGTARVLPTAGTELFDFLFEPEAARSMLRTKKISPILFKKLLENVITNNKVISTQIPFIRNQREISARVTLIPVCDGGLDVDWVILLIKDFSKEAEHVGLSEEEITELTKYQQITATVIDGLIGTNKNGKITFWNESASKLFGLTRSEVYGKFLGKIFSNIDEKYFAELKNQVRDKKEWRGQFRIGEDESIADYYDVKIGVVGEEDEETVFLLCTPVTDRVNQEKKIKISEERFRNIVTNSNEFICTLDLRGRITYANPHFLEVFQYTETEIISLEFPELIDPYYPIKEPFEFKNIAEKQLHTFELPLLTKLGQRIHVLSSFSSVEDITGTVQYYNVILTDITLKKESEKDLMLIRSVFEASQNGIVLLNKKRIALVNDSFVEMFGFNSASEILGMNPLDFIDEKDKERVASLIGLAEEGKEAPSRFYFTGRKKNFLQFEVENSVSTYEIENEKFAVWILRDVTDEKKAQNALAISEERYRSITENISESIWTAERQDGKLKAVFYTPAIKKITSYEAQEFLDDPALWKKIIHPDDVDDVVDKLHKFYADSARFTNAIECRIIDTLGNVIWIEDRITVVRDIKGDIHKIFGIVSDISLSKKAEEELKKSAQNLKELNETKDRFISIISHDLRTPFSSILGFTDLLLNDKELDEEGKTQYIRYIQESSKSMLSLVNSLLDWTRLQTGSVKFEPERINAKELIEKSMQILSGAAIQKKIVLISEMQKDFYVHADSGLLLQVFNNLISNAIKFTKSGGSIRINAQPNIEKKQVEFSVKDDGVGISKEDIPKLFKVDSKYTTSGTAGEKGSGLGLSLVHDIIQKHGGEIWVESESGKGTEFIFSIPVASANILLVDDVKTDRLLYSKLIKSLIPSYKILEAENGKQALDVIKQASPALVITDHKMPVMSGYDLVKQLNITELKYKPPVIVLSSDINKSIEAEYKDLGVEFIFEKPVNLANFKNAIERSLRKAIFN